MRNHVSVLTGLLTSVFAQSLPYKPTSILYDAAHDSAPYILLPSADSSAYRLVALNISSTLDPSNITFNPVTPAIPFSVNASTALVPALLPTSEIQVYSGSCSSATSSELWRFRAADGKVDDDGSWTQETLASASDVNFLAGGFSFSTYVSSNASTTDFYVFGGMCPTASAQSATWQSAAEYSNRMLKITPASSGTAATLDVLFSRGPPIPEAGFAITGLTPTYLNGSGVTTQQQNFVLLGGHTGTAFINMSQVAIWSLPEEAWTFVTVESSSGQTNPNTELTVKSTVTSIDSRSGHTAILTEDGSKIIVFGGWVGDISQAADPQLAVLELGTGFGGSGNWQWSVPANQPTGSGIYGHGAALLPGGVMMILGGYNISASGSTKRAIDQEIYVQFFNTTSMTWAPNYTNPAYVAAQSASNNTSSSSSSAMKIGLGVGLGLGLAILLSAIMLCFCYSRYLKKKRREQREKDLQNLSRSVSNYYISPQQEMSSRSSFPWSNNGWNGNNFGNSEEYNGTSLDRDSAITGYENIQTGAHYLGDNRDIPSPPRQIPRKPLHSRARGVYQPASAYDGAQGRGGSLGTAGPIHPIYEADENDHEGTFAGPVGIAGGDRNTTAEHVETQRYSDPFRDPVLYTTPRRQNSVRSVAESESPAASREREIQDWVTDWAAADMIMNSQLRSHSGMGRVSPTRRAQVVAASIVNSVSGEEGDSGRTESNLSEHTERSFAVSGMSISRSGSDARGRSRSNSLRGFITGMNPFTSNTQVSTAGSTTLVGTVIAQPAPPSSGSGSGRSVKSFNTANTSFPALQAEGENLVPRPADIHRSPEQSPTHSEAAIDEPGSPSKLKPLARKGWLGSLKRVFVTPPEQTNSPTTYYPEGSNSQRPEVDAPSLQPRRAASSSASLWRRKQGRTDWEDSLLPVERRNTLTGLGPGPQLSPGISTGSNMSEGDEDEWDIERAVENRVVQVMFTVPKEKLRVVNHDVDEDRSERGSLLSKKSLKEMNVVGEMAEPRVDPIREDLEQEEGRWLASGNGGGKEKGKGRGEERPREREQSPTPSKSSSRTSRGKVAEMVEKMEARSSPER